MAQKKTIIIEAKDKTGVAFNKVKKNLKQTDKAVDKTKRSFDGLKAGIKGAIGALTIGAFVQATRSTLDMADALGKTADRLGLTTTGLQTLKFAATQSGMSTEMLEMSLQRFTRRLAEADKGTGVLKDTFKELGIDIRDPNDRLKSAEALLGDVADKMAAIPDQGERVRLAFSMFDSEGVKMVNMLQGGKKGFDELRQSLIDTGAIMEDEFIDSAQEANDALDKLGTQIRVAFANAISGLAPAITATASALGDFVKMAREYPVITALAASISAVGLAFALFGGPITIALTAISALITGAVALNNHLKTQKELANIAGLSMVDLKKHYKNVSREIEELNQKMKEREKIWGTTEGVGLGKIKEQLDLLKEQKAQIVASMEAEKKKGEVVAGTAVKTFQIQSTIAEDHRRQQLQLSEFQIADSKAKAAQEIEIAQMMYTKKLDAAFAHSASIRALRLKELQESNDAIDVQQEAHANWLDQKEGFRDAEGEALQEEHERQKALVDAAYMGEVQNKELHTANMLLIDKRYEQAKDMLAAQRLATILGQASQVAAELNKRGLMGFDTMKSFAIAEAIVNAYVAASKAWAQGGVFGAVSAGLTLAMAMAQVDNIRKTTPAKREMGGSVSRGKSFMVGERGPELFTPNQSGGITPNNQMGNANVTFNIQANDARGFDQLLQARRGMIIGMINKSMRNNAQMGIL